MLRYITFIILSSCGLSSCIDSSSASLDPSQSTPPIYHFPFDGTGIETMTGRVLNNGPLNLTGDRYNQANRAAAVGPGQNLVFSEIPELQFLNDPDTTYCISVFTRPFRPALQELLAGGIASLMVISDREGIPLLLFAAKTSPDSTLFGVISAPHQFDQNNGGECDLYGLVASVADKTGDSYYHIAYQETGTQGELWIDGELLAASTVTWGSADCNRSLISEESSLFLGGMSGLNAGPFTGSLDDIKVFPRSLAPYEILVLANH